MKNHVTLITGLLTLVLMVGPGRQSDDSVANEAGSLRADIQVDKVSPAPPVPVVGTVSIAESLPEVRMYAPESCSVCEQLFREIEKAGGEQTLPFRLVKLPLLSWMQDGPWFYWKSEQSPSGWSRLHGLGVVNGKRLDFLLQEWLETQPQERKVSETFQTGVTVCCCKGTDTAACLCLEEIRNGIKRGPCTCNARFGSRHFMDANRRPIGPAGGYRELAVETPVVRIQSYCPTCRRR